MFFAPWSVSWCQGLLAILNLRRYSGVGSACIPDSCLVPGESIVVRQGTGNRIFLLALYVFPFLVTHYGATLFHQIPFPLSYVWRSVPHLARRWPLVGSALANYVVVPQFHWCLRQILLCLCLPFGLRLANLALATCFLAWFSFVGVVESHHTSSQTLF